MCRGIDRRVALPLERPSTFSGHGCPPSWADGIQTIVAHHGSRGSSYPATGPASGPTAPRPARSAAQARHWAGRRQRSCFQLPAARSSTGVSGLPRIDRYLNSPNEAERAVAGAGYRNQRVGVAIGARLGYRSSDFSASLVSFRQGASVSESVSSITLHHVMAALTARRACRGRRPDRSPAGRVPRHPVFRPATVDFQLAEFSGGRVEFHSAPVLWRQGSTSTTPCLPAAGSTSPARGLVSHPALPEWVEVPAGVMLPGSRNPSPE